MSCDQIYKLEEGLDFQSNEINDRKEPKNEEEEEKDDLSFQYGTFLSKCKDTNEFNFELIRDFLELFSPNLHILSIEPLLETNFPNLILGELFKINEIQIDQECEMNPEFISNFINFLEVLKILLSKSAFPTQILGCYLIPFLVSKLHINNEEIIRSLVSCIYEIANKNIINRFFTFNYEASGVLQGDEFIENLWQVFNKHCGNFTSVSNDVCHFIIDIYKTFSTNIELGIFSKALEKLRIILVDSENYQNHSLEAIEEFSTSEMHLQAMEQHHFIPSIVHFLSIAESLVLASVRKFVEELKEVDDESKKSALINFCKEKIECNEATFPMIEFQTFLEEKFADDNERIGEFAAIHDKFNRWQSIAMRILSRFVQNRLFSELNPSLIFSIIANFGFGSCEDLKISVIEFIQESLNLFPDFKIVFFENFNRIYPFIKFCITDGRNTYGAKVSGFLLAAQIVSVAKFDFVSEIIIGTHFDLVEKIIFFLSEVQEDDVFVQICRTLCKLIDMGIAASFLPQFQDAFSEINRNDQDYLKKRVTMHAGFLLKKIDALSQQQID